LAIIAGKTELGNRQACGRAVCGDKTRKPKTEIRLQKFRIAAKERKEHKTQSNDLIFGSLASLCSFTAIYAIGSRISKRSKD
jgi:hypothetical protein